MSRIRTAAALAALLVLSACDDPQKTPPAAPVIAPTRAESLANAAAAESAKVFERAYAKAHTPFAITVTGSQHFSSDTNFRVSCVSSESGGERLLQVEALKREARTTFTIYNPREGSAPVGNNYTRRRAKTRIGNLEVSVGARSYTDGRGTADITDPLGRTGSIRASNFVRMGVKKRQSHGADLSVRLRWNCE